MNNDERLKSTISFTLMLATLALGWSTLNDRWALPKLAADRSLGVVATSEQDVTARLWEDPLQAVAAEFSKTKSTNSHTSSEFQPLAHQKVATNGSMLLLVIPVPGTPFPDDVETRLRLRYSVQMALAHQHCAPDDGNHLGYVNLFWPAAVHPTRDRQPDYSAFSTTNPKIVQIPYEWFSSRSQSHLKVLTVWLPEELLGNEPLCRLAYLRDQLTAAGTTNPVPRVLGPFVVGPRSSDSLKAMAAGGFAAGKHRCADLLRTNLCVFSPQATAPDALVGLAPDPCWTNARSDLDRRLDSRLSADEANWIYFENFVAPDDQLTDLLVQELQLRGVKLHPGSHDRVLLLAEADTSYGRALPLAFQASVRSLREGLLEVGKSATPLNLLDAAAASDSDANLVIARYLRGLDAQKGFQSGDSGSRDRSRSAEQLLVDALNKKSAAASGESQLDYAERLAEKLSADEAGGQVKAVGILGGDIYDKLILLRSLRLRFGDALFFTTDLDARLWHPDHYSKFTHNLVVASAHDLKLNAGGTRFQMPPFRDVYQVAVFNACSDAIARASGKTNTCATPLPGIYEIGRRGPVKLTLATADASGGPQLRPSRKVFALLLAPVALGLWALLRTRHKPTPGPEVEWRDLFRRRTAGAGFFLLGTTGLLVLLACCTHERVFVATALLNASFWLLLCVLQLQDLRQHRILAGIEFSDLFRARTGWLGWFGLATLLMLVLAAVGIRAVRTLPGSEPWSWAEGVSIWPTELIRLLTIASVVWMLVWARQRHWRHRRRLAEHYLLAAESDSGLDQKSAAKPVLARIFEPWVAPTGAASAGRERIDAVAVFKCYCGKAQPGARWIRAGLAAFIYYLFGMSVMLFVGFPDNLHVRGRFAFVLDQLILHTSIFGWLALVFYVLDAVCLSAQMLNRIAAPFTVWPPALLEKHAAELRVNQDHLEGYLDVQFAAEKTQETGKLILLPFLIQFLMLVARSSYFDNWTWPPGLLFIFIGNMVLAATAWGILRRAAARLKTKALDELRHNLRAIEAELAAEKKPAANTIANSAPAPQADSEFAVKVQKLGLEEIKRRIETELRGAYARWLQDPAFLAILIPTGLFGILSILFQALFGLM
jgi:hypothetical protein